ncbi:hypothetical protein [Neorhizobium sp. NCHU2750]|uniref:hypothetical protein n=1 Tax=Neorhizobium sp. NCHU2750 TaxID=1825976 RepID=UPI000E72BD0B|nr:hypothetical protein NCHU2750_17970 [Neorhizobium sp. NCHU2750]
MAFQGIHFALFQSARVGSVSSETDALMLIDSETLAKDGESRLIGPVPSAKFGHATLRVDASADAWVSVSETPDAAEGVRILVRAGVPEKLLINQRAKIAWKKA